MNKELKSTIEEIEKLVELNLKTISDGTEIVLHKLKSSDFNEEDKELCITLLSDFPLKVNLTNDLLKDLKLFSSLNIDDNKKEDQDNGI